MKLLVLLCAMASIASADVDSTSRSDAKPECAYWSGNIRRLEIAIYLQKDKLEICKENCRDTEILLNSLNREKEVTQEFLSDPFYGCASKK